MPYIEREKARELIINFGKGAIEDGMKTLDPVDDIILLSSGVDLIPAADVVEVVRCKDCAVPHNKWLGCPKMNGLIPPPNHFCSYGVKKECADQKPVTNFECVKKNIAKMSIDELAKIIKDSDNCEKYCAYTKDGSCNKFRDDGKGDCVDGVKLWLESEVSD